MQMASYLVTAVLVEGQSVRAVARDHGVSKTWVYELLARYEAEGDAGLTPRSKRPHRSPTKIADLFEDEIVRIRKELESAGFDAGPETIEVHLKRAHRRAVVPSRSTIYRVLRSRGFIVPEPHKRPRSSWIRFCADLPNECWQMDVTHVTLQNGSDVEVLNMLDDHSRLCVASRARRVYRAIDVVTSFHLAAATWGYPASMLSDNAAVFTAAARHGVCVMESELSALGIEFKHSRPEHPQTCGKVERFHQTLKKHLRAQRQARSLSGLQAQLDAFVAYYNEVRPHRALGRRTPVVVFSARKVARPKRKGVAVPPHCRLRQDKVNSGNITLRYRSTLYHVAVGRAHEGRRVMVLVADRDVRVLTSSGELLRHLRLDPKRLYQPLGLGNRP
jgi:transposase InsO family protein